MAKVFKRKYFTKDGTLRTSRVYYCRFQIAGRDYLRSTGTTSWAEAKREMERMRRAVLEGATAGQATKLFQEALRELPEAGRAEARAEVAESLFRELQAVLRALPEDRRADAQKGFSKRLMQGLGEKLALANAWEAWLKHPNAGSPSPVTVKGYLGYWNRFKDWAVGSGIEYLHEVTPAVAENYAADLWGSGIAPRTFNGHVKFLKSLFKVLRRVASVEVNPFEDIRLREQATESRRSFTAMELETIFSESKGDMRYLVALGVFSGMRLGDCVCLRWEEVDLKAGLISHVPFKTRRKGKEVVVPIHAILAAMLQELQRSSRGKYLFPKLVKIYDHDPSAISKRFSKFLQNQCGIETKESAASVGGQRKNAVSRVGFHSLRHSFVSLCAAEGVPQVVMQELIGHGSPVMTAIYSHSNLEQRQAAIAGLPNFGIENGGSLEAPRG